MAGMFSQSSAQSNYLSWFGLLIVLHALGTAFLMGWSTIEDSMPNFLIATKLGHVIYLIAVTYYWVYAEAFMSYAKTEKGASTEFLNLVFGISFLGTIGLLVVDGVIVGVKLIPTLVDCYRDPPDLPLPLECDYGNEKTVFTVTSSVHIAHIVVEFLILILLAVIHTGIAGTYRRAGSFWYPFARKQCPTKKEESFLKDFEGQVGEPVVEDIAIEMKPPIIKRLDTHIQNQILYKSK